MAHSKDILRVQKVNGVRDIRLSRALDQARQVQAQAEANERAAAQRLIQQTEIAVEARRALSASPACAQTRLWQSVAQERRQAAGMATEEAERARQDASAQAALRAQAVRVHRIRTDRIYDHGRMLRREENRLVEILNEDEAQPRNSGQAQ